MGLELRFSVTVQKRSLLNAVSNGRLGSTTTDRISRESVTTDPPGPFYDTDLDLNCVTELTTKATSTLRMSATNRTLMSLKSGGRDGSIVARLLCVSAHSTQIERPFHGKASRHSTRSRAEIPQQGERCGRGCSPSAAAKSARHRHSMRRTRGSAMASMRFAHPCAWYRAERPVGRFRFMDALLKVAEIANPPLRALDIIASSFREVGIRCRKIEFLILHNETYQHISSVKARYKCRVLPSIFP
ncbi:hypothetical protein AWB83_01843 [Caballeronia ptereochthonis]|uniref:Uncharacterized protein n=1 Tax=Caballeronia ptereochthonis TaxID=1777144 RepID=A0A158AHP5_9BURK|nr:hypothetical protein AWB83_01843 [Caballeronia ptereochthonis]